MAKRWPSPAAASWRWARTADIKARAGTATQVIDLGGRAMTPGLIDTHVHFTEVDALFNIDLSDQAIKTMDDVAGARRGAGRQGEARRVDYAATAGTKASWPSGATSPPPTSTRWRRTTRCGSRNTTGHYGVGNSYAMKIAELRKGTPDPPAGTIVHERRRRAQRRGARERAELITRHVPPIRASSRRPAS